MKEVDTTHTKPSPTTVPLWGWVGGAHTVGFWKNNHRRFPEVCLFGVVLWGFSVWLAALGCLYRTAFEALSALVGGVCWGGGLVGAGVGWLVCGLVIV